MNKDRKAASSQIDALLQALSLLPGLPLAIDEAPAALAPPGPEMVPITLLDRVLREHPGMTRPEASAMLIAFGSSPEKDVRVIHAWRRSGLRAYQRVPSPSDQEMKS